MLWMTHLQKVVHCRGGLGRASTIAARLLIELLGMAAEVAIQKVRSAPPGGIGAREGVPWRGGAPGDDDA